MTQLVALTKHDRLATIVLDNPPVNALSHALRVALIDVLGQALGDPDVLAIVLACNGRTFVAGADIKEFGKPPIAPDVTDLIEFVGAAEKPIVAALHGTSLGGGVELALACSYRVAAAGSKVGFPEVTLGILPGGGGTQRLPRLIGARAALELIVGGAPIPAERAHALGVVDAVVTGDAKAGAEQFARKLIADGAPVRKASDGQAKLDDAGLFADFERSVRERSRGALAPMYCLEAVRAAVELPFAEGLVRERKLFQELMASPQARALRHVFFAEREIARVPGLPEGTAVRELTRAAVIGAGATGRTIALRLLDAGIPVTLVAGLEEDLESARDEARRRSERLVRSGKLTPDSAAERLGRLATTRALADIREADFVLEAVAEDDTAKRAVFEELGKHAKPGAVVATTSAYVDVEKLGDEAKRAQSVVAMHFPRLAEGGRVVEIARTRRTELEAWATALKLGRSLGSIAVPMLAGPGLVGQRMLARQILEGLLLLEAGALPEQVDRALREFGFAEGIFEALDRTGLSASGLRDELGRVAGSERARACDIVDKLAASGRLGQSVGRGFYRYGADGERLPDPEVEALLVEHSKARGVARTAISAEELGERCVFALIHEGAKILEAGGVARALDIDVVWVQGYSFPAHRGGPMFYADELGLPQVHQTLTRLAGRHGSEWTPAPLVERLALGAQRFYGKA